MVNACYQTFSLDNIKPFILDLQKKSNYIFIYGISRLSAMCKKQLDDMGVDCEGYVVSDGQARPEKIGEKSVYCLQEVLSVYPNSGFVLAVQPVNADSIIDVLRKNGIENYCEPYKVTKK